MFSIQETGKSGGVFDVKPDTSAPLTITAADIRKIGDKKGTWSKTITLSATKNNGKRLGFLFEINVENSTFDRNKKLPVLLLQNNVEIEGFFFMQLVKINKKMNRTVSYEVVVKDDVVDFFTIIQGRYLTDLDFSDDNHFLTAANVVAKFPATIATSNYKYHLTFNDNEVFDISQFKAAIYARKYWDRIHARAGKAYEWAGMNSADVQFDKWLVPSNVDKANSDTNNLVVATRSAWNTTTAPASGVPAPITLAPLIIDTEVFDIANTYNPVTGTYTSPIQVNAGSSVVYNFKFTYLFGIKNNTGALIKLFGGLGSQVSAFSRIYVKRNGVAITQNLIPITSQPNPQVGDTIAAGVTRNYHTAQVTMSIGVSGFNQGDLLTLALLLQQFYSGGAYWGDNGTGVAASVSNVVDLKTVEMTIAPNGGNGYGYGEYIQLNKYIPQKVKQSEFVAAIMTLNNLIVDKDKSTQNKIVYVKRDEYLDAGVVKDWDKGLKLDKGQEHEITFIPDLTAKRQVLTYKEDTDEANVGYKENVNEVYGQQEYTFKSEFAKDTETTEIVFSPTPIAELSFGAVVPAYSGKTPTGGIRLLFDGGTKDCGTFKVVNYSGSEVVVTGGYPYVGHFDDPKSPKLDLNFGVCDYYFYQSLQSLTNRNMFNLNWRRTFNQIDNGRMLTGMFNLNEYDIKTLRLNDKIFVENEYWNINKVIDYDPNARKLTKVELISVDDLLKIPTRTKIPVLVGAGSVISSVLNKVITKVNAGLNTLPSWGQVFVLGKGNIADSAVKNALIVGDNQSIEKDGVYTPYLKATDADFDNMPTVGGSPLGSGVWQPLDPTLTGLAGLDATTGYVVQTGVDLFTKRTITTPNDGLTTTNGNGVAGNTAIVPANDLAAIEALAGTGFPARVGTDAWAMRALIAPSFGLTIANNGGVAGNPTFALADDLAAVEGLATTGIAVRTATSTWATRTMAAPAAGFTITNPAGLAGNPTFALANDLAALEALGGTGFAVRTAADTWAQRTLTGTAGQIAITNTGGVAGNPVFSLDASIVTGAGLWQVQASGVVLAGNSNSITGIGTQGGVVTGNGNAIVASGLASSNAAAILGGTNNSITDSDLAVILGGDGNVITHQGELAFGINGAIGQCGYWTCYAQTTNTTTTEMFATGTERFTIPTGATYYANITVIGRRSNGLSISWTMNTLVKNVGGTVTTVGASAITTISELGGAPALTVDVDNVTNKNLRIRVTGLALNTINWFGKIEYVKVV